MPKDSDIPKVRAAKVADLIPDSSNANQGTERGAYLLRQSVERAGIGRGIVVDRHLNVIGGNKTHATVGELGLDDVILVSSDGTKLIVTVREDLDLSAEPGTAEYDNARTLSLSDNRAGEVNLSWDAVVLADYSENIELSDWFREDELGEFFGNAQAGEWGTGEGDDADDNEGDRTTSSGGDPSKAKAQPTGIKTPLAITLTSGELKRWNAFKEQRNLKGDTTAFLRLLALAEED